MRQARDLVRVLQEARQAINPKLLQMVDSGRGGGGGGGRSRYRNTSSSNNPNMMYQDECNRRMRDGGGNRDGRFSRNSRDGDRTQSYRDRSRDERSSYGSDQYQSYGNSSAAGGYDPRSGGQPVGGAAMAQPGLFGPNAAAPAPAGPHVGPQPLMTQQFAAPQPPLMGFIGQQPCAFNPLPPGTA